MISIHSCWICLKGNETPPCPVHFQKCYFINMGFSFWVIVVLPLIVVVEISLQLHWSLLSDWWPKLWSFWLYRMMVMWKDMSVSHQAQMKAVETLKRLDNSAASEPTSTFHRHSTVQLEAALNKYVGSFFFPSSSGVYSINILILFGSWEGTLTFLVDLVPNSLSSTIGFNVPKHWSYKVIRACLHVHILIFNCLLGGLWCCRKWWALRETTWGIWQGGCE